MEFAASRWKCASATADLGANLVEVWRPTPLLNASGAAPRYASMTPWVLSRPSQFRLQGPPALDSAVYKADISEVNTMGVFSGSGRSSDQSDSVLERQHAALLESYCGANFYRTGVVSGRECSLVRGVERGNGRCGDSLRGWKVPLYKERRPPKKVFIG
jgi:hypothetical protein